MIDYRKTMRSWACELEPGFWLIREADGKEFEVVNVNDRMEDIEYTIISDGKRYTHIASPQKDFLCYPKGDVPSHLVSVLDRPIPPKPEPKMIQKSFKQFSWYCKFKRRF